MRTPLTLKVGTRVKHAVSDLAEASRIYQALRDQSGEGASTWPDGSVGRYRISFNGRVWLGEELVLEAVRT